MKFTVKHFVPLLAVAVVAARAVFSFAAPVAFSEPGTWSVGDIGSTYQQWDAAPSPNTIVTNLDHTANPSTGSPTIGVAGAFVTGSGGFYSFSSNYTVTATIPGTGTAGPGTHILVQTAATLGTSSGVFHDGIRILDSSDNVLATSSAAEVTQLFYSPTFPSSFGEVEYEELIYSLYLPGFTGDFKVAVDVSIHSSFQSLRVDSLIAAVPEPGSIALLSSGLLGLGMVGFRRYRRQR